VTVTRATNGTGGDGPPRGFSDYAVTVNEVGLPPGITIETKI
jgi:hypothetical protein